jgi:Mitochondrial ATP synthase B chain precursor (ATP-synt_B)
LLPFSFFDRKIPTATTQRLDFHVSAKREEDAKPVDAPAPAKSGWDPLYSIPLGIAIAVPAINYEWYLVNEETQLAACFIAFTAIVYKQFGGVIQETLEADGKRIIEEHNKYEDQILSVLKTKRDEVVMMKDIVKDAQDVHALKEETYVKLNAAGKIKPQHEFKAQIERVLSMMVAEEAAVTEKSKVALMEEATKAVTKELMTNKKLQKQSLDNAIAQLKGTKPGADPVKESYLTYFKWKATEAAKADVVAEAAAARESMVKKLNAVAANEGFFFQFDADGKPKMTV